MQSFKQFIIEHMDKAQRNLGGATLKHMTKNSQSKTMKFYINRSGDMHSGDSFSHTHHSLGAHVTDLWGGITHHTDDDSYHYAAHKFDANVEGNNKYPIAHHERLNNLEKQGVKRGVWNKDTNMVDKAHG